MAPFLMAFAPAQPGEPPAPWKPAQGGYAIDIFAEIHVPRSLRIANFYNRLNTVWWFAALVRLYAIPRLRVPVISDISWP